MGIHATHFSLSLSWYGRVIDGPLFRRCKASEAQWALEDDEVSVMLPKDDGYFWKGLFEGGEEKSHQEVYEELCNADEPGKRYDDMDEEEKDFVDEYRETKAMFARGEVDPETYDDFKVVLSDADGAK